MIDVSTILDLLPGDYWQEILEGYYFLSEHDTLDLFREPAIQKPEEWIHDNPWSFANIIFTLSSSDQYLFDQQTYYTDYLTTFWGTVKHLIEYNVTTIDELRYKFPLFGTMFDFSEIYIRGFELRAQERRFRNGLDLDFDSVESYSRRILCYGKERYASYLNLNLIEFLANNPCLLYDIFVRKFLERSKSGRLLLCNLKPSKPREYLQDDF